MSADRPNRSARSTLLAERAHAMRQCPTWSEQVLWERVLRRRGLGVEFRRQVVIGRVVDSGNARGVDVPALLARPRLEAPDLEGEAFRTTEIGKALCKLLAPSLVAGDQRKAMDGERGCRLREYEVLDLRDGGVLAGEPRQNQAPQGVEVGLRTEE
jgi:hypothetical protein